VAGVIHSRLVLGPSGSGFTPPNEISYRGLKLPGFLRLLGDFKLRCEVNFPQVYPLRKDFCRRPGFGGWAYRCSLGTNTVLGNVTNGLLALLLEGGAVN
jgi:hypothetical protein